MYTPVCLRGASMEKNRKNNTWFSKLSDVDQSTVARLRSDNRGGGDGSSPSLRTYSVLNEIFRKNVRDVSDNRNIFRTMPKLIFPRKILVSAIASPGDLSQTALIVGNGLTLTDYNLSAQMTRVVQDFVDKELNLVPRVHEIIDTALILEGAKPILILPNKAIDRLIGVSSDGYSVESKSSMDTLEGGWFKPIGLLHTPGLNDDYSKTYSPEASRHFNLAQNKSLHTITMEAKQKGKSSTTVDLPIMITDNIEVLGGYLSETINHLVPKDNIYSDSALTMESKRNGKNKTQLKDSDVYRMLFKNTKGKTGTQGIEVIPPPLDHDLEKSGGNPIEFRLSKDAVIPIGLPGEHGNHSRYIVVLDRNGFPVSTASKLDYYSDLRKANSGVSNIGEGPGSAAGAMMASAADSLGITGQSEMSDTIIDSMVNIHTDLVISDLLPRIRSSMGGEDLEIGMSDSTAKLMLARTLKNQHTTLLYVPAEYMIYFAFDYDEVGVGKSILDDAKSLIGLSAVLTVANVMGSVENAIPGKNISIKLDDDDGDPLNSATFMAREAMSLANRRFPSGASSIAGIAEELQMASTSITVQNHPKFPDIETSVSAKESSHNPIDSELMNGLLDDINMLFFVTPEITGSTGQPDFATTVVNNSIMLLKAVIEKQDIANKHFSHYLRTYTKYSGVLVSRLYALVEGNKKDVPKAYKGDIDLFVRDFVEALILKLPSPETDNIDNRMQKFTALAGHLETFLDIHVNAESLMAEGYGLETVNQMLPIVREAYKNHVLRQYARDSALMPEFDIFVPGDEENPAVSLSEDIASHSVNMIKSIKDFLEKVKSSLAEGDLAKVSNLDEANRDKASNLGGTGEEESTDYDSGSGSDDDDLDDESGDTGEEDVDPDLEADGSMDGEEDEDPKAVDDLPIEDVEIEEEDEEV